MSLPDGAFDWPWDRHLERDNLAVRRFADGAYVEFRGRLVALLRPRRRPHLAYRDRQPGPGPRVCTVDAHLASGSIWAGSSPASFSKTVVSAAGRRVRGWHRLTEKHTLGPCRPELSHDQRDRDRGRDEICDCALVGVKFAVFAWTILLMNLWAICGSSVSSLHVRSAELSTGGL